MKDAMKESKASIERLGFVFTFSPLLILCTLQRLGHSFLFVKIFEGCYAFFSFFFVVKVDEASLLSTLFGEEFAPVASLVERAGVGDRMPVEPPASDFRLKRWARVTLSRFDATTRIDHPAEVFPFHLAFSTKDFG
jgi:hypothetical protein